MIRSSYSFKRILLRTFPESDSYMFLKVNIKVLRRILLLPVIAG